MSKGIAIAPDGMCPEGKEYRIEEHYYNRGMVYLQLKEYEKAKKDLLHTLVIDINFKKAAIALKENFSEDEEKVNKKIKNKKRN